MMVVRTQEVLKRCDPFGVCYTKQQVETCGQENPRYPDTAGVPCSFKTQATLHCAALPSCPGFLRPPETSQRNGESWVCDNWTYEFSILWWCWSYLRLLETVLCIWAFPLTRDSLCYTFSLGWASAPPNTAASQSCDHNSKRSHSAEHWVANLLCLVV